MIKTIAYLCSIILPFLDALKGVKKGIKDEIEQCKYDKQCQDIYKFVEEETETTIEDFEDVDKKSV